MTNRQDNTMYKRLMLLVLKTGLIVGSVFPAYLLYQKTYRFVSNLFDIGFVRVGMGELLEISKVLFVCCGSILLATAFIRKEGFWTSGKRFVNELYAIGLGLSISTLYIFTATDIIFAPPYYLSLFTVVFGLFLILYLLLSPMRRRHVDDTHTGFFSALVRTFLSPAHWVVLLVASTPVVLMVMYKLDENWANAINRFRTQFAMSSDVEWAVRDRFPGHEFMQPISLEQSVNRPYSLYVLERVGRIEQMTVLNENVTRDTLIDFSQRVDTDAENGALGMALHPEFGLSHSPNRGFVYVYYTVVDGDRQLNRLVRFDLSAETPEERLASESVLIEQTRNVNGFHNAGDVSFGPDGFLYVSFGDALDEKNHQVMNRGFFCGIIRIDVDQVGGKRSHPIQIQPQIGKTQGYFIPNDNPFAGTEGSLEEFYALGFRNPFRMSFDTLTGLLWVSDNGDSSWEEVNVVNPGSNCQYPAYEGEERRSELQTLAGVETPPFYAYPHNAYERSIIGGFVYRANKHAGLRDKYIYGDGFAGRLYALDSDTRNSKATDLAIVPFKGQAGLSSIFTTLDGEILLTTLGFKEHSSGKILQLYKKSESDYLEEETFNVYAEMSSREFFKNQCSICHGLQGKGDGPRAKDLKKKPKDLTSEEWHQKVTDKHIYDVISKGGSAVGLDNGMPGWHLILKPMQIEDMVEYVRELRNPEESNDIGHQASLKTEQK